IKAAEYFGISPVAITNWGDIIPEKRARQLSMNFPGYFKFDPEMYQRNSRVYHHEC
ncbi:hypothetical protein IB691_13360, partial [Fangia hongkongensis]|nr:hypothetical protein [Fangia hongkongensis]